MGAYLEIATATGELVERKNAQYGDAFEKTPRFLEVLYPNGIPIEQYPNIALLMRMFDKFGRIATQHPGDAEDPWQDLEGYSILAQKMVRDAKARSEAQKLLAEAEHE